MTIDCIRERNIVVGPQLQYGHTVTASWTSRDGDEEWEEEENRSGHENRILEEVAQDLLVTVASE